MKKIFWLIVGIFAGMEIKKQLDKNPNAQALLADATARGKELAETATEAFLDRTAELTGTPRPAKSAAKKQLLVSLRLRSQLLLRSLLPKVSSYKAFN